VKESFPSRLEHEIATPQQSAIIYHFMFTQRSL
jgi:hypothetical protein